MTLLELITKWNGGIEYGSQAKFAKIIGASTASLAQWVQGKYMPSSETQAKIAAELDISMDKLLQALLNTKHEKEVALTHLETPIKYAKVLGALSSDRFNYVRESSTPLDVIAFPYYGREDDVFALKVKGDFLEPIVRNGEYVIVRKQDSADDGQTALLHYNGNFTLKTVTKKEDLYEIAPVNGIGKTEKAHPRDFSIEGIVIMSVRKWI